MKTYMIKIVTLVFISVMFIRCEREITEFGFDSTIKGTVKDNNGTSLYGDLSANNLVVFVLGEGDEQPIQIRVDGEGTYQNLKMFPKKHKVWLEGPIVKSDTFSVDFNLQPDVVQNFVVTPLISPEVISGSANGTSINVQYDILANNGNTIKKKEIYCSTVKYPTAATGSRTNVYFTKTVSLPALSGSITIDGLESGVEYHLRIGVQANASAVMNYSNQIVVKTN